jgi:tetratricopeptide (TPR) repeat protein
LRKVDLKDDFRFRKDLQESRAITCCFSIVFAWVHIDEIVDNGVIFLALTSRKSPQSRLVERMEMEVRMQMKCSGEIGSESLPGHGNSYQVRSRFYSHSLYYFWLLILAGGLTLPAAELDECRQLFWSGQYAKCIEIAKEKVDVGTWNEGWARLLIEAYSTTGKYEEALAVYEKVKDRYSNSLVLRLQAIDALRYNRQEGKSRAELDAIPAMIERAPWQYTTREQLIPLGRYFLSIGEDARKVLEQCYDRALKQDPKMVDAHIASAELALQKEDYAVALKSLEVAAKLQPTDPKIAYLLARAWSESSSEKMSASLQQALTLNPHHPESLLLAAEMRIDAEAYDDAEKILTEVEQVNPYQPKMWALRAVIAHLSGKFDQEEASRKKALEKWPLNPEVDFVIGSKLSRHYLFSEGVKYLRRSLEMDAEYLPAKSQLAQDLLRLGQTDEGWALVAEVRQKDSYNVTVFNLRQLQEHLDKFTTLEIPGFVVRMEAAEAELYGGAVLKLLSEARRILVAKYQSKLQEPIYVEIFPNQSDFAIRTFGMPGGEGFLGVCFGRLITANSPAAQGESPSNWQSVLWHEYCHVVTLQKSQNRMPRWLSEGISVYEETQRKGSWGMPMDVTYRAMILGENLDDKAGIVAKGLGGAENVTTQPRSYLRPLSKMSAAFMDAKSPMELQFAYFQSSLAVRFLIEKFGIESLQRILDSLAKGLSIQDALQRHAGSLEQLDIEFEKYARQAANDWSAKGDFTKLDLPTGSDWDQWRQVLDENPNNLPLLRGAVMMLIESERYDTALRLLDQWQKILPEDASPSGVYALRAVVHRKLKQPDEERKSLIEIVLRNADAVDALRRLIELDRESGRQSEVLQWTAEILAVNPFLSEVHRVRAEAAEKLRQMPIAAESWRAILQLKPIDPAEAHLRYAQACLAIQQNELAKRHALMAIEEAPRYREALKLLSQIVDNTDQETRAFAPDDQPGPPEPLNAQENSK